MNTLIAITKIWLCATGVAVVASYGVMTNYRNTASGQRKASETVARISRHGTIPDYHAKNRHSSVVSKTTSAKVAKVVKRPVYVANPIYPAFAKALAVLTEEVADIAKDGAVKLDKRFVLTQKNGKPTLEFPEEYGKVVIGGVAIGDKLENCCCLVRTRRIDGTDQEKVDEIAICRSKHLEEPEFYCSDVIYSVLPATKQVESISMHGNLIIGNATKAQRMIREITKWMKEDFEAVDLHADVPDDKLALKKFRIGREMSVEVAVNRNPQLTEDGCDARVDITFRTEELAAEKKAQCQELGRATDEARVRELDKTGINYFTVCPRVNADAVRSGTVY